MLYEKLQIQSFALNQK